MEPPTIRNSLQCRISGCNSPLTQESPKENLIHIQFAANCLNKTTWSIFPGGFKKAYIEMLSKSQIDNLAITKNCQKRPRAARDPIHPWSGALLLSVYCASMPWNIYLRWSSLALKPTIEFSFDLDPNIQRDEQNRRRHATIQKPSCSEGNPCHALKTNSAQQTADQKCPYCRFCRN